MRRFLTICLTLCVLGCKSPLAGLKEESSGPALGFSAVTVEDHSRQLKRLKAVGPAETNTPESRRTALDEYGTWLESAFRGQAETCGIRMTDEAPYRLELRVTDLGEVRTKYIVYGIASGVAWGVGVGLLAHNTRLALGLGGYELMEESAFWIGGSSLFSSFSAPVVVEARLFRKGEDAPLWTETYHALNGRAWTKDLPKTARSNRTVQLRASLENNIQKIFEDLETIPGFPKGTRKLLAAPPTAPSIRERIAPADGLGRATPATP